MWLVTGAKLGPYEIVSPLGAGGMGEVYLARDTRLGRDVAVKVLPTHLCSDPNQRQRLEREAKTISSLNHPNICQLHDIGCQDGIDFIVMEYLDGQTLTDQLSSGPLLLKQALKIAIEMADALDKAHARGIIHRDLKPGNIMLTKSGTSKLMDFGLAKPMSTVFEGAAASAPPLTPSAPTMSIANLVLPPALVTEQGAIIGTLLYLAPEVLRGEAADTRNDIFSFGCVLYEMITGKRPFNGQSQLSVISAILEKDPEPMAELQPLTPASVEHVVQRCLAKDPGERWQTARDLVRELTWVAETNAVTKVESPKSRRLQWIPWAVVAVCLALLGWLGLARWRSAAASQRQPFRLSLLPPPSTSFVPYGLAISPDGRRLAFVASGRDGERMLWVRSLASSTAQQISGTEGALYPFWSGDSREIGFSDGGKMKRADPSTGAIEVICSAGSPFGNAWNDRGVILFAVGAAGPLYKVDASGGSPQVITKVNGEESHGWPTFLPDQNHFLYIVSNSEHHAENGTYVGSLTSMEKKQISSEIVTNMQFGSGRLFFVRDRSLMAQPFDVKRLELTGKAEIIAAQELEQDPAFSRSSFSVSDNGVVVFQSAADNFSRLTWFDRAGKELETLPATGFRDPSLSRNGSLLTVSADDQRNGKQVIRIYNFARGTSTRITNSGNEVFPQISPDGKTVAYRNTDGNSISTVAVDNSGQTKLLFVGVGSIPNDWSKDGRYLLFMDFKVGGSLLNIYDSQQGSKRSYSKIGAEAQFSPDGNWVASIGPGAGPASDNYWDTEILVTKFPNAGGRVQISNNGGAQPRWRADGKELYFIDGNKKLMAVSIDTSHGKVEAGIPHVLFQTRIIAPRVVLFQYAVSPDGNRFLINSLPSVGAAPVTVLIN